MWKVGELAQKVGVTVRALHHYDAIGLLKPSGRSASGYRLYNASDAERLGHIVLLKRLGLGLDEVAAAIDGGPGVLEGTIGKHIERLQDRIVSQQAALARLRALQRQIQQGQRRLECVMEAVEMIEKYYTQEQLDALEQRRQAMGQDAIEDVQRQWEVLFEDFKAAMGAAAAPDDPHVQGLARRARELVAMFTGGDAGISGSLNTMYKQEGGPKVLGQHGYGGVDAALWDYMGQARAALEENNGT